MELADTMGVASLLRKHLVSDVGSDLLAEPNWPRTSSSARPTWRSFHPQGG